MQMLELNNVICGPSSRIGRVRLCVRVRPLCSSRKRSKGPVGVVTLVLLQRLGQSLPPPQGHVQPSRRTRSFCPWFSFLQSPPACAGDINSSTWSSSFRGPSVWHTTSDSFRGPPEVFLEGSSFVFLSKLAVAEVAASPPDSLLRCLLPVVSGTTWLVGMPVAPVTEGLVLSPLLKTDHSHLCSVLDPPFHSTGRCLSLGQERWDSHTDLWKRYVFSFIYILNFFPRCFIAFREQVLNLFC